MKEVIAMIRPEKWLATVDAAINVGAESYIHNRVMGRGPPTRSAIHAAGERPGRWRHAIPPKAHAHLVGSG